MGMEVKVRNVRRNPVGTIDMEIDHPAYGWIPFTASPNDVELHGRELYAQVNAGLLSSAIDSAQNQS
jgi:hypothetical protein